MSFTKEHETWSWDKLVCEGIIQYIDNSEIEGCVIAMSPDESKGRDYCEIHPAMQMGVMGNMIPFPDHSQSPRNCYQSSMGKQSIGIPTLACLIRTDTILHVMPTLQKPIVTTKASNIMKMSNMPAGMMAIVAILTYGGYNQEDSVILNKSAVERGLFYTTTYHTISCEEKRRDGNESEKIQVPECNIRKDNLNYGFLNENGIVRKGIYVQKGDVIVGKIITKIAKEGPCSHVDCSAVIKYGDEGTVDRVIQRITPNGYRLVKVVLRNNRIPEVGDKFASRSAQKGTCGAILSAEDMPFTNDGICPDIIINPHCKPSRMTINQLLECVLGKACCITGKEGDATPFQESSTNAVSIICEKLHNAGFERHGLETMYNGMTGKIIDAKIFIGPTYYQRLKHMVSDKIHARAEGQVTMLTRQALEGGSRDGGLRFGEMERDCVIAQGATRFLKERLHDVSDPFKIDICKACGSLWTNKSECHVCNNDSKMIINMPYATKLLIQELQAMSIKMDINVL